MLKRTYFLSFIYFLISCQTGVNSQTPLDLYQNIPDKEQIIKKFYGYSISRREYIYVFDSRKNVYLIENFKENKSHHLDFNNDVNVSEDKEKELYELIFFLEKHKIVSIKGDFQNNKGWERVEFRTNENQILVYYDNLIVKNNLINLYKSFKVIDNHWGEFENNEK
jgi:hypothetical protein